MADVVATSLSPVDAKAEIRISPDKLHALVFLTPPLNGGASLTYMQLTSALAQKGVMHGVDHERLKSLAELPMYDDTVLVASGSPPIDGDDAVLTYHIRLEKDLKPKVKEDGSVDFRDLGIIEQVEAGALLCEKKPRTLGEEGINVFGQPVKPKAGKDAVMPAGKNTVLSADKLTLTAKITGQAEYINHKINVLNTHTIEGDVSTATGNINFSGNILVKGNIMKGFLVSASGNVDVQGTVESAQVIAGGSVIVRGGFYGVDGGRMEAGENITCKFIQGGYIKLTGNLSTTYILNAEVHCGGSVNLSGKGLIMGSHVMARVSVSAVNLGSASSAGGTIVEVGNDPELAKRSYEIPKEMQACAANIRKVEMMVKTLIQLKSAGRLTPDKFEQLEKSLHLLAQLKNTYTELTQEHEIVKEQLTHIGTGLIKVSNTAFAGVKIIIGSEHFPLQSEYTFTTFMRTKEGISAGPMK